ncbi:MAG: hypothetical protein ACI9OU_001116 [Candidatus Promineifilaceae bacterium]|jgi:hypothetical protein
MLKSELLKRTPLRILDESTHGGLTAGDVGVLVAPKGTGKHACLVHIATIRLLEGKHVVHLSFSENTSHIVSWYEKIFEAVAKRHNLENASDIHDETVKNRIIVNFRQDDNPVQRLEKSLELLEQSAHFHADRLIVDGFDFTKESVEGLKELRRFAKAAGYCIWMSASMDLGQGDTPVPAALEPFIDEIAVMVGLEHVDNHVQLRLIKDRDTSDLADMHLTLDPETLLITEDSVVV